MNEYDFSSRASSQICKVHRNFAGNIDYLLSAEEQFLQSISAHLPLPAVLNGICSALDCQIGNVISLISLPGCDVSDVATVAKNAERFGLHTFYSEHVIDANNEILGSLEMYSSVSRSPYATEIQLIERAKFVAAIAIKLNIDADHHGNWSLGKDLSEPGCLPEWRLRTLFFAHLKRSRPGR
jgi:hypothetical protein